MQNTIKVAIRAIIVNKVRSFLTMLGVIIGVASVVLLTSIGNGLKAYVADQFESLGSNSIFIYPGKIFDESGGFSQTSETEIYSSNKFKMTEVNEIKSLREFISTAIPFNQSSDNASFQNKEESVTVIGTTYEFSDVMNIKMEKGQFFDKIDDSSGKKVVAIGHKIAEKLFGSSDPIGKKIKIGNSTYTIVGVSEKKGAGFGGPSFDSYIYLPFKTFSKAYDRENVIEIVAKAKDKNKMDETIKAIEKQMLKKFDEDEFSVLDQSEILSTINEILNVLTIGLGGIAAISLVVGGIGIMNIMLVSVTERTREIGLRKALGATPNKILLQFLVEAALLSVIGGLIGLGIAWLGSIAMQAYFPAKVTTGAVMLAFGVSTAVGLIFGATPARRASQLSPIEALRYE